MKKIIPKKRRKVAAAVVVGMPGLVLLLVLVLRHADALPSLACPIRRQFDILCPGCGMTRALVSLAHLRIRESVRFHPLALTGAVFAILFYLEQCFAVFGKKLCLVPRNKWVYIGIFALFAAYCILRNFPAFAFLSMA